MTPLNQTLKPSSALSLPPIKDLSQLTNIFAGDAVKEFRPTWYTEHWANLKLKKNGSFTFRFEDKSYLATLIVTKDGAFVHHTINERSRETARALSQKMTQLEINDGSSQEVDEARQRLIGQNKLSGLFVSRGGVTEPDTVRLLFEDGSFAIMIFKSASLIAVEHIQRNKKKTVYGVDGKDLGHKSLDLITTACTGFETIVTQAPKIPDFSITLPPKPQLRTPKKFPKISGPNPQ